MPNSPRALTTPWLPRSGFDEVGGYIWLGRLLDKARRLQEGGDLGDYLLFEASPMDGMALRGWKVTGVQLAAWVAEGLSDEAIAHRVAAAAGHDPAAQRRWNGRFLLLNGLFLKGNDADEGRIPPGLQATLLTAAMGILFRGVKVVNALRGVK